jgi:hypothetical protein
VMCLICFIIFALSCWKQQNITSRCTANSLLY